MIAEMKAMSKSWYKQNCWTFESKVQYFQNAGFHSNEWTDEFIKECEKKYFS